MGWLLEILQRYSVREQVKNDQAHEGGQGGGEGGSNEQHVVRGGWVGCSAEVDEWRDVLP